MPPTRQRDDQRIPFQRSVVLRWASALAGGRYQALSGGEWKTPVVVWDQDGRGPRQERAFALTTIMDILPCGSGFAVGASDPFLALLAADGSPRLSKSGVTPDMRDKKGDAFQVSRDGRQVRFGLGVGAAKPALFDLTRATFTAGATASGLAAARITGIAVTGLGEQPRACTHKMGAGGMSALGAKWKGPIGISR